MIKNTDFINWIKRYVSIDFAVLFLVVWVLACHYRHGEYTSVFDCLKDIRLRNAILIFFYYSVSRLSFRFIRWESYVISLVILLLVSLREAYAGVLQLFQGAPYPVGTMLNPNVFACLLSITCSIIVVLIFRLKNWLLTVPLYIVLGAFAVLMVFSRSRLSLLAVVVPAICFFSLNPRFSGFIRKHVIWIAILLILLFAVLYFLKKPSADGRLYMAKIAAKGIVHNVIWGTGTDSYAGTFGYEQYRYFSDYSDNVDISTLVCLDKGDAEYACTPMTAFNEFLRIGVEYGLVAMLLVLYVFIRGMILLIRNGSALGYGLLSLFVISQFSYPHCYSVYCLFLSMFIGAAGSIDCHANTKYKYAPLVTNVLEVSLFGMMLFLELPQMESRNKLENMESDIAFFFKNQEYRVVCDYCEELPYKELFSLNLLYEYGISLSMTGQYVKSDSVLHAGASRSSNPVFWHEIGHNHLRSGDYAKAEQSYIRSFMMVPNRMTPLFYLAQLYHHMGDNDKLERIASYSDTFKPKVPSYTTDEYHERIKQFADEKRE